MEEDGDGVVESLVDVGGVDEGDGYRELANRYSWLFFVMVVGMVMEMDCTCEDRCSVSKLTINSK